MNARLILVVVILSILLLGACSANATPTEEAKLDNIYTAVASTLSAQGMSATPTPTGTKFVIATPFTLPTTRPATVTSKNAVVSYSSASTTNGCNDASYVSDVTIADGTVLAPGETFTKTWEFQNMGSCAWNENYLISFVSGSAMDTDATEVVSDDASTATPTATPTPTEIESYP